MHSSCLPVHNSGPHCFPLQMPNMLLSVVQWIRLIKRHAIFFAIELSAQANRC